MLPSVEIRWFTEGPLPDAVRRWHEAVAGTPDWEERTDHYVRPVGRDGINVKWREGKLEVKRLVATISIERPVEGVAAPAERWRKWSLPLADDEPIEQTGGDWIAVAKRRRVRTFAPDPEGARPVEAGQQLAAGCGVEIGEMRVGERVWWSVCLEAFGDDEPSIPETLRVVATHVFGSGDPPELPLNHAMSYIGWLAGLDA
jgi:hypothetical protein